MRYSTWVNDQVEERNLQGLARETVEETLQRDGTLRSLWEASHAADERQSGLYRAESRSDVRESLVDARRATDEALDKLADAVIEEVLDTSIGSHTVDLRHAQRVDCPACSEDGVEVFYLGTSDDGVGWVCGHCESDLVEDRETGEFRPLGEGVET